MTEKEEMLDKLRRLSLVDIPKVDGLVSKLEEWLGDLRAGFPDVDGRVEAAPGMVPVTYVTLWPRYRPSESSRMFTFVRESGHFALLGSSASNRQVFASPQEVYQFLVSMIDNPDFVATLLEYKRRNLESAIGMLRTGALGQILQSDVVIELPAGAVRAIAEGSTEPIVVHQYPGTSYDSFKPTVAYKYLTVAGYSAEVDKVSPDKTNPISLQVWCRPLGPAPES